MITTLVVPNDERTGAMAALWHELKATADPFPFECVDEELQIRQPQAECEHMGDDRVAMASLFPDDTTGRICVGEALFREPHCVQLAVLLHEAVHIRLWVTSLRRQWLASQAEFFYESPFEEVRNRIAMELLRVVAEIGVDKFMASRYAWISSRYWHERCRNFYIDSMRSVVEPEHITPSLEPYAAFYRLLVLDLGLLVVTSNEDLADLRGRKDAYTAALVTSCNDEQMAGWLESWRTKLLALDPFRTDPDPDAYDELRARVLQLSE